jgi:hypothetical protein
MPILKPQALIRAQRRKTTPQSIGAPLKGWNTRDPFEAMDPLDAITLDNWFPDFAGLLSRKGSAQFASGLGSVPVQTLAVFENGTQHTMLAACNGQFFDVSAGGIAGVALASGFTSDIWQSALFNQHLILVNGSDPAQIYNGSTMTVTGFTGANMATMIGVGSFNNRMYFWDGQSCGFWYGPTLGIAGALSFFPFSMVTDFGGVLVSVQVLSYDGGSGIDDYTCFFLSTGEVLMYQGTDPANPNNWALVGRYMIASPISVRAITRYGGDVYITTANDHQQLSKLLIALKLGETPPRSKASGAVQAAYQLGKNLKGWQALYYGAGTSTIYNIPNPDGSFSQHVYNTSTQAWCRYRGLNGYHFAVFQNNLYFGAANGVVMQADTGTSDFGNSVLSYAQQAWQLFGTPLAKRVAAVRPVVQSQGLANFAFSLGYDYQTPNITIPDATIPAGQALIWGIGHWGTPWVWGGTGVTDPRWHIAGGEGGAIGLALSANTLLQTTWVRTDFLIEPGTAL